jgi:hypothetical protein
MPRIFKFTPNNSFAFYSTSESFNQQMFSGACKALMHNGLSNSSLSPLLKRYSFAFKEFILEGLGDDCWWPCTMSHVSSMSSVTEDGGSSWAAIRRSTGAWLQAARVMQGASVIAGVAPQGMRKGLV